MIGKIKRGQSFYGLCRYLLIPNKEPRIIQTILATQSDKPVDLAREFTLWARCRPRVKRPVVHIAIGYAPSDGQISDKTRVAIANALLKGMGHGSCQSLIVAHGPKDPSHPKEHNHMHDHVVTSAVDLDGGFVPDSFDRYKVQRVARAIEREYGLESLLSSWEMNQDPVLVAAHKELEEALAKTSEDEEQGSLVQ